MIRMFPGRYWAASFLDGTTSVFENAVTEFFVNAKVIAGTIVSTVCSRKLVVTDDTFSATFKLPIAGITGLADISKETIVETCHSWLLRYFTCEKFEFMAAISTGISVNWGIILFQRFLSMVQNPKKQSQGYTVLITLMETLVKADLGASIKMHPQNVLTSKSVQTYIKKNQDIAPEGETSKRTKDTASNTEVSRPQQVELAVTESLAAKEKGVNKPTKRKATGEGQKKKKTQKAAGMAKQRIEKPSYADSHQQLVDELASVKSQLAAMVESIKELGADKKGEGGQNRPGQGLNRTKEGSSGGQSSLRGRRSSSKEEEVPVQRSFKPKRQDLVKERPAQRVVDKVKPVRNLKGNAFNDDVPSSYKHLKRRRNFKLDAYNVSTGNIYYRYIQRVYIEEKRSCEGRITHDDYLALIKQRSLPLTNKLSKEKAEFKFESANSSDTHTDC
ncbi:hypothetical protein F511_16262 [Dorcoceras hygrometricum]|uniref:Uncharacterized protein n=1 Tax=Dorcoceras hygrometricum TaxID=472368 RepID=A0A2Z7BSY1_9LAMI|nr:hypothetical protein F511_16262 [Dorcoceras hygrometricum]